MDGLQNTYSKKVGATIHNIKVIQRDVGMRCIRREGAFILLLVIIALLSACTAGDKTSESGNDKVTNTVSVQPENYRFLDRFLSEDQTSVQMDNLEWGMTLAGVLETLGLEEGTYSIIRQEENDQNEPISQIRVSGQIVVGRTSVEAIRVFAFLDDALYIGEYSMIFERVEDMVAVCADLQDQIEQLDLDNRLLRIPVSYDSSLDLLSEDRVHACYEGEAFGELFWVEGISSRNEFHIAIPESDDPDINRTLIVRVESGQIPHI